MTSPRPALGLLLAACAAGAASAAMAQSGPPIAIGTVDAEEQCRLYQQYAGSRAVYADPWVYASRTSFFSVTLS